MIAYVPLFHMFTNLDTTNWTKVTDREYAYYTENGRELSLRMVYKAIGGSNFYASMWCVIFLVPYSNKKDV